MIGLMPEASSRGGFGVLLLMLIAFIYALMVFVSYGMFRRKPFGDRWVVRLSPLLLLFQLAAVLMYFYKDYIDWPKALFNLGVCFIYCFSFYAARLRHD